MADPDKLFLFPANTRCQTGFNNPVELLKKEVARGLCSNGVCIRTVAGAVKLTVNHKNTRT